MKTVFYLTLGYFLRTPDNSSLFSISLERSSYRESTVVITLVKHLVQFLTLIYYFILCTTFSNLFWGQAEGKTVLFSAKILQVKGFVENSSC